MRQRNLVLAAKHVKIGLDLLKIVELHLPEESKVRCKGDKRCEACTPLCQVRRDLEAAKHFINDGTDILMKEIKGTEQRKENG